MLDPELSAKLDAIAAKADAAYEAAHKAERYLFWTGVITVALFVLPLIGLVFAIPYFLNTYVGGMQPYLNTTSSSVQPSAQTTQNLSQTAQLLNQLGL